MNLTKRKVFIIYTGGTIGMQHTPQGYQPKPGLIAEQMALMPELNHPLMPEYAIKEYHDPIDSSNMAPQAWGTIANDIAANIQHYDAFIILHGTDTMAYTAAALSFMLENLSKPVILLGSQLPLVEIRNDARANLITALLIASQHAIPEVCIYFNDKLLRGNRARKLNTHSFAAFDSPNFPPLATVGIDININRDLWLKAPDRTNLQVQVIHEKPIVYLRLFPGIETMLFEKILALPLAGLIIETYGSGNAPDKDPAFLRCLKNATERGIIIVNCTQCICGGVDMEYYATGNNLLQAGVISAGDMTPEATIAKLYYLLSKNLSTAEIKEQMHVNLRGELTL